MEDLASFWILLAAVSGLAIATIVLGSLVLLLNLRAALAPYLVSFSAGVIASTALAIFLSEAVEDTVARPGGDLSVLFLILLATLGAMLALDAFIGGRDHAAHDSEVGRRSAQVLLLADGVHRTIEGALIGILFAADPTGGLIGVAAIAGHEVPKEWGKFGVLFRAGYSNRRAFGLAALSAAPMVVFAAFSYWWSVWVVPGLEPLLMAAVAAGFLYVALADLVPTLRHDWNRTRRVALPLIFWVGLGLPLLLHWLLHSAVDTI